MTTFHCMAKGKKSLRHRTSLPTGDDGINNNNDNDNDNNDNNSSNIKYNHMSYSRRSIATPLSRGGNNNALPKSRSLTSYRNKFFIIIAFTSFYTAFLYQRGQCSFQFQFDVFQFDLIWFNSIQFNSIYTNHHSYRLAWIFVVAVVVFVVVEYLHWTTKTVWLQLSRSGDWFGF